MSFLDNWSPWRLREQKAKLLALDASVSEQLTELSVKVQDLALEKRCWQVDLRLADECKDQAYRERDAAVERLQAAVEQRAAAVRRADKVGAQRDAAVAALRKLRTTIFVAKSDAKALAVKLQKLHEASCDEEGLV